MLHAEAEAMRNWLTWLGPSHPQRVRTIDGLFEQRTATIWSTCYADLSRAVQVTGADIAHRLDKPMARLVAKSMKTRHVAVPGYVFFTVGRSLSSMDFRERTYLKFASCSTAPTRAMTRRTGCGGPRWYGGTARARCTARFSRACLPAANRRLRTARPSSG
ncbi:MAG: hypothetical protein ABSA53_28600 [Streptosporangiaceae bacterium]